MSVGGVTLGRCAGSLVSLVLFAACAADVLRRDSPFALFGRDDMRAGLPFEVLDDAARKESVRQYQCVALWAGARRCSLPIETGSLVAVVDSTGRVIRLIAAADSASRVRSSVHNLLILRDVVRETRAAWDSAGTLHRDGMDADAPQLRWSDGTGRWGASLWYSRAHRADVHTSAAAMDAELAISLPESLGVTDLPAYAVFVGRQPSPTVVPPVVVTTPAMPTNTSPTRDELLMRLRSDLRALTIAEEGVVHATGYYETRLEKLNIVRSAGVALNFVNATPDGWSAVATHRSLPGVSCVVFAGSVSAPPVTRKFRRGAPGEIVCDP